MDEKQKNLQFTLRFGLQDREAEEWLDRQENKSAYLKKLIMADKARRGEPLSVVTRQDRLDGEWEEKYRLLLAFVDEFDRLPGSGEEYRGVNLGRWLYSHAARDGESRPDRMEKLEEILGADKWERSYGCVLAFREAFGRLPRSGERQGGVAVGAWLARQRLLLRSGEGLSPEQKKKLEALGLFGSDWERKLALVQAFAQENGRLPKYVDTYEGVAVGRWLAEQKKTADPVKRERLAALGAYQKKTSKKKTSKP